MSDIEQRLRQELWLNHGHPAPYGDDGEMQCNHPECALWDYKRAPIGDLIKQVDMIRLINAAKAQAAAKAAPVPKKPWYQGPCPNHPDGPACKCIW